MHSILKLLIKISDGSRWRRFFQNHLEVYRRNRADDALDRQMAALGPVRITPGEKTIIGEGMWRNANHFFRLRLFIEAMAARGNYSLLGVLRSRSDWRDQRAMRRIGFKEFIYLDEDDEFKTEDFFSEADRLFAGVRTHRDILTLPLPESLPAYTFYDTVLKRALHPQAPLDDPLWRICLAETLRNAAIYNRELSRRQVEHIAVSHAWKNEWATLVWLALARNIRCYHLTSYCDAIRIRRFVNTNDYSLPKDCLSFSDFEALTPAVQDYFSTIGARDLLNREDVISTDINIRYAFDPTRRITDRGAARMALSSQTKKPIGVIYCPFGFDYPHVFAMKNFTDFADWFKATVSRISEIEDVIWLLKPHPIERWKSGGSLVELEFDLPPHVRLLPSETDSATAMNAADAIITIHGTVGLEASARGVSTIAADRSYFSDWGCVHTARDRDDYFRLLGEVGRLARPNAEARRRALACFASALAAPPAEIEMMPMSNDAGGSSLYNEISKLYTDKPDVIAAEVVRIGEFIDQDEIDGYATYHLIKGARAATSHHQMTATGR